MGHSVTRTERLPSGGVGFFSCLSFEQKHENNEFDAITSRSSLFLFFHDRRGFGNLSEFSADQVLQMDMQKITMLIRSTVSN